MEKYTNTHGVDHGDKILAADLSPLGLQYIPKIKMDTPSVTTPTGLLKDIEMLGSLHGETPVTQSHSRNMNDFIAIKRSVT